MGTNMPTKITLQSNDGEPFKVDLAVAKKSKTISTMLQDLGVEEKETDEEEIKEILPLPNIQAYHLQKVIDWCEQFVNEPEPSDEPDPEAKDGATKVIRDLDKWETDFIKEISPIDEKGCSALFDVIIAANYLHIQGLLNLTTMEVARMMKDKTPEQIRQHFVIENDLEDDDKDKAEGGKEDTKMEE